MFLSHASVTDILSAASTLNPSPGDALMVLVAERNAPDLDELRRALRPASPRFFGGIFPAVLSGARAHDEGAVVLALPALEAPRVCAVTAEAGPSCADLDLPSADPCTAILLADGMSPGISEFLAGVFRQLGSATHCVGGGAGVSAMVQQPCVFTPEGVFENAAVMAFVPWRCSLGVQHGMKRLVGPIVATRTHQNIVVELNWRPALEVYRAIVEKDTGHPLTADNFYDSGRAWAYPFGLVREGSEDVVRDPLAVVDGGIRCAGGVPENTALHVLKGDADHLIAAARRAGERAAAGARSRPRAALICDCVSRRMFLKGRFPEELAAVHAALRPLDHLEPEGMLTIGELSSSGESLLDFYNKTIVVGLLCDA